MRRDRMRYGGKGVIFKEVVRLFRAKRSGN